uniref:Kinesin-like protein n=1 Tax=Cucumis melo TaxID=3656 RepID=A0A9I9CG39_CUCME
MVPLTPDQSKKSGVGVTPTPAPFLTPRPERRRTDSRGSDSNSNHHQQNRDKEVNVQVVLRCRPLNDDEQKSNVSQVISCNEIRREVSVLQSVANKQVDRIFSFDKVFGPKAQQRSIYEQAIAPIVNEVLEGFNCTVFAYGQTGSGKTYTMEGGMKNKNKDLPAEAGVIPRAVRQIFDTLEEQNADYSMKVTFLELYNEEITDLLAQEDQSRSAEEKQKKPISLMEDGKGAVVVRGLEEEAVYSLSEIYTLLERGSARRRTADTLLNKRSSRSHSIFSITLHIKESSVGDEELIKCGKLNLVDLAGSENISRSGAREARAREAGEINKSLLTLGRCINALVEHSSHIPYRDSKLTRLLRDSLGGKTKTCVIATISPSANCLDETLSTLDYAHRAKYIKNKPEANQKISKAVLLKDLYLEIERMKEDIRAARDKNGVYIPRERYAQDEAEKKEKSERIEQLENDLNLSEKQVESFRELYLVEQKMKLDMERELKDCMINLENRNKALSELQDEHGLAIAALKEKESIISQLKTSENSLLQRAKSLRVDLQNASEDISLLFDKIDRKDRMEAENQSRVLTFGSQLDQNLKDLHKIILGSVSQHQEQLRSMEEHAHTYLASKSDATQILETKVGKMSQTCSLGIAALRQLIKTLQQNVSSDLEQMNATVSSQAINVENVRILDAKEVVKEIQSSLSDQKQLIDLHVRRQEEGLQHSLVSAQKISSASMNFFNELHSHASKVMTLLEESQIERSNQLVNFEKTFKEQAEKEEKQALSNIAAIIANLTSKKSEMVSKASINIQEWNLQHNKILQQEMSSMQQVSNHAKKDMNEYVEKVESHFTESMISSNESKNVLESAIDECAAQRDWIILKDYGKMRNHR